MKGLRESLSRKNNLKSKYKNQNFDRAFLTELISLLNKIFPRSSKRGIVFRSIGASLDLDAIKLQKHYPL